MIPGCIPLLLTVALAVDGERPYVTLASTTSTENSGLLSYVLPRFTEETGVDVRVVARGTGQAIRLAERGDCDVILVHHRPSEDAFVRDGYGVERHEVMYNDFVLVGPKSDPAGVHGLTDVAEAFDRIRTRAVTFASRGDDSGTHKREVEVWSATDRGVPGDGARGWYRETGSGMGATLNIAQQLDAYCLTDRGTWISFKNKDRLALMVKGDARLHNPYGAILVSPKRHPHVKAAHGQRLIDWLRSDAGRDAIEGFRLHGEQLFHAADAREETSSATADACGGEIR